MIRKYCAKTIEFVALNLSSRSASVLFFIYKAYHCTGTHESRTADIAKTVGTKKRGRGYACSRYTTSAPDLSGNMLASSTYRSRPASGILVLQQSLFKLMTNQMQKWRQGSKR